jgi:sigma-B regulation protein RsbU (phosphoserine phosphatase)
MPPADLLRLAELALSGHVSPQLAEEILRAVVEDSNSRAGVLRRGEEVRSSWPRSVSRQVEDATGGWTEIPFGDDRSPWRLRLLAPERLDQSVLGAARVALRAVELRDELKRTRFDERFRLWELETIRSIANDIGGILEVDRLARELINHLVALLGVRSAAVYLGSDPSSAEVVSRFGPLTLAADQLERAWEQGIYTDAVLALPLQATSGTLGVLVAANKEARAGTEPFAGNDIRVMELFAVQVTMAMEFARLTRASLERERLKRELEVAAEIQSHLHPLAYPEFAGYRLAARSSPSRQVAGDTYDVLVNDHRLVAIVADVSGKGVGAGLLAAGIHASVRLLSETEESLAGVASRINRYLVGATEDNRFVTFAMVRLEADGGLVAVNAGHCPILIRRRDGRVEQIPSSGLPLGILAAAGHRESRNRLEPGDLLLLYTDGLTEAENPNEEEFGTHRVESAVAGLCSPSAESACRDLLQAVDDHAGGRPLQDDATLLVVERLPAAG